MIGVALAAFLLLLAAVYLMARPYLAPLPEPEDLSVEQLRADRERLRAQVRELDADFETGKLAREEYRRLRARRLQQLEGVTRRIRELEHLEDGVEPEPAPPRLEALDRAVEDRIAERKRLLAELEARSCPTCATPIEPEDRFCRHCGAALATAEVKDP
ncbi:hypothetical protein HRbin12_00078 [bacterium HR12]|nr:hypothetical protein HRbin12_00078 [bacterium HR12]